MRLIGDVLREKYGEKVYKLSLSSGCTCPTRDGTLGFGGCAFCSEGGSGEFAAGFDDINAQISEAKRRIAQKTGARKFIAYFQSYTNTYGDVERLERLYTAAIERPEVVILSLGTRPDCLGDEVLAMLRRLRRIKPVWVELGLQTARDDIAQALGRGYRREVFEMAREALYDEGIDVVVHLIFSLPGESREDMLASVRYLASLRHPPEGIKLQMLNVLKGSRLGESYLREPFPLLGREEYAELVAESVAILPPETIVHRLTGDGPAPLIIAPEWVKEKKKTLNLIRQKTAQL